MKATPGAFLRMKPNTTIHLKRELPTLPAGLTAERIKAARNPNPRCATALVLDCSASMAGEPIFELQEALHQFLTTLAEDPACQASVEPAVVTCGGTARLAMPFTSLMDIDRSQLLLLETEGETPLGAALTIAIESVLAQRTSYRRSGLPVYKPVIVVLTDGQPTDTWRPVAARLKELAAVVQLVLVGIGPNADMDVLRELAQPSLPPLRLAECDFATLFQLLSDSLRSLSTSGQSTAALEPLRELLP